MNDLSSNTHKSIDHSQLPSINTAKLPETYEAAKTALANCASLDECQSWADRAEALASYAKQAKDDGLKKMADRIQARAIRRAGEILKQIEPGKTGPKSSVLGAGDHTQLSKSDAAESAGMSKHQQVQATRVASISESEFIGMIEGETPPTVTALAEMGTKRQLVDLKGRDPKEFNKALHFIALFDRHLKKCDEYNVEQVTAILTTEEAAELRSIINKIDVIHDQIMTRI